MRDALARKIMETLTLKGRLQTYVLDKGVDKGVTPRIVLVMSFVDQEIDAEYEGGHTSNGPNSLDSVEEFLRLAIACPVDVSIQWKDISVRLKELEETR